MKKLFTFFLTVLFLVSCFSPFIADKETIKITSKNATVFYYYSFDYFLTKNPNNEIPIRFKRIDNYEYYLDLENLNKFSYLDFINLHIDDSKLERLYSIIKEKNQNSDLDIIYDPEHYNFIRIKLDKDVYYDFDGQLLIGTYDNQDIKLNGNFEVYTIGSNKPEGSDWTMVEMDLFLEKYGIDKYVRNLVSSAIEDYFKDVFSKKCNLENPNDINFSIENNYLSTVISNGDYLIQKGESNYDKYKLSNDILKELFPKMEGNTINISNKHICYFYIYDKKTYYEPVDYESEMKVLACYRMVSRRIGDTTWILNDLDKKYGKLNQDIFKWN